MTLVVCAVEKMRSSHVLEFAGWRTRAVENTRSRDEAGVFYSTWFAYPCSGRCWRIQGCGECDLQTVHHLWCTVGNKVPACRLASQTVSEVRKNKLGIDRASARVLSPRLYWDGNVHGGLIQWH